MHNNSMVISHTAYLMCEADDLIGEALTTTELGELLYASFHLLEQNCDFPTYAGIVEWKASKTLSWAKVVSHALFDQGAWLSGPFTFAVDERMEWLRGGGNAGAVEASADSIVQDINAQSDLGVQAVVERGYVVSITLLS